MPRNDPDGILRGPELDRLRTKHPDFIANRLEFGLGLMLPNTDLSNAYIDYLGKDWAGPDMHNLQALIRFMGAQEDEVNKVFHGVGLRK